MSSLTILGDTSGSVALTAATVAGSTAITIAAQSGTLNVGGPAFSAYLNATQSISSSTYTKILFDTEVFDTNNNFASSRFTPTVAGYYQVTAACYVSCGPTYISSRCFLYKNGASFYSGNWNYNGGNTIGTDSVAIVTGLIYCNGSTDYIEAYGYCQGNAGSLAAASSVTYFNGFLARTA
jgi:hypothetical protein